MADKEERPVKKDRKKSPGQEKDNQGRIYHLRKGKGQGAAYFFSDLVRSFL